MNHNIPEFTVSELSRSIKMMMEDNFGYVRIKGEISGFKKSSSGHLYFNLKDELAVINAVCFRQIASLIEFNMEDGLEVIASGKVTIYEGRSNYQIIVEKIEIAGIGALLAAIEKRRIKLLEQGYFDEKNKKPLPFLPKFIGVITSPTGAVIEDIINRITARFPTNLIVYPAVMQGKNAASEVISGIKYFNQEKKVEVIIIARGGGSFEDLLPFNDEDLVREVFKSKIPIISAVGHETDTTLIDYASDLRAPTPTAAAELVVPVLKDLQNLTANLNKRLSNYCCNLLDIKSNKLLSAASNLGNPQRRIVDLQQKLSQLLFYLKNNINNHLKSSENNLRMIEGQISKPQNYYHNWQNQLNFLNKNLQTNLQNHLVNLQNKVNSYQNLLISYDYKNVLKRGYAVVRTEKNIIDRADKVKNNQAINIEMMDGNFNAVVFNQIKSLPKKKESDKIHQEKDDLLFYLSKS